MVRVVLSGRCVLPCGARSLYSPFGASSSPYAASSISSLYWPCSMRLLYSFPLTIPSASIASRTLRDVASLREYRRMMWRLCVNRESLPSPARAGGNAPCDASCDAAGSTQASVTTTVTLDTLGHGEESERKRSGGGFCDVPMAIRTCLSLLPFSLWTS